MSMLVVVGIVRDSRLVGIVRGKKRNSSRSEH